MSSLNIDLVTPGGVTLAETQIPSDFKVSQILNEIVEQLSLPATTAQGQRIYHLKWVGKNVTLALTDTLLEAGVRSGDSLEILASERGDGSPQENVIGADASHRSVAVLVTVVDLNQSSTEEFDLDCTLAQVVAELKTKYRLSDATYRIRSKSLGRSLAPSESLRSAGIPARDTLAVVRQELAGGPSQPGALLASFEALGRPARYQAIP